MTTAIAARMAGLIAICAAPALADHHQTKEQPDTPKAEVVETNGEGKATKVKIGEQVYDVCVAEGQDSCINPRDAGLDFGTRELDYWPGKPASQIDEPLPAENPAEVPVEKSADPQES